MKMKSKTMEVWGLIFILFSFGWQLFEEKINDVGVNSELYYLHDKLDNLWDVHKALYSQLSSDKSGYSASVNLAIMDENWTTFKGMKKDLSSLNNQISVFKGVRILIFFIGSILLILAKIKEK